MSVFISAPYPALQTTSVLPDPEFGDSRASESGLQVKRSMLGTVKTYVTPQDTEVLTLRFLLTRKKEAEVDQFLTAYHTADWRVTLTDGSQWVAKLIGRPIRRVRTQRIDENNQRTGDEEVDLTFTFSATKLP
jgi:hypothetical protein